MHVDTATVKRIFTRHMLISRKKGGFSLGNMISNTVYNHYLTAYAPKTSPALTHTRKASWKVFTNPF